MHIPVGTYISVKSFPINAGCMFVNATETELFCQNRGLRVNFHRANIRQIRVERPTHSPFLGVLVGMAAGTAIGVAATHGSNDAETKVYGPAGLAIVGGFIGGALMSGLIVRHGKVVYRK